LFRSPRWTRSWPSAPAYTSARTCRAPRHGAGPCPGAYRGRRNGRRSVSPRYRGSRPSERFSGPAHAQVLPHPFYRRHGPGFQPDGHQQIAETPGLACWAAGHEKSRCHLVDGLIELRAAVFEPGPAGFGNFDTDTVEIRAVTQKRGALEVPDAGGERALAVTLAGHAGVPAQGKPGAVEALDGGRSHAVSWLNAAAGRRPPLAAADAGVQVSACRCG